MTSTVFPIPLTNGQHVVDVQNITGYHQIMLGFTQYPAVGAMAIEFKPIGVDGWFPVPEAQALNLAQPRYAIAFGGIDKFRFTISGLSGGQGLFCQVITTQQWPGIGMPPGIFTNDRAMTVQSYTEGNVKNGSQFSATTYLTGLTAGEIIDVIVITGDKPVLIKGQGIDIKNSDDILLDWYKGPTYSGGTDISSGIYNQSDINRLPSTVTLIGLLPTNPGAGDYSPNDATKVTVTNVGTKIIPTLVALGTSGIGGSSQARAVVEGLEQVLDANSTYLFRRTARGATDSLFGFSTWFEGEPDFPRT